MHQLKKLEGTKLAHRLRFFGMHGCSTCMFALPLLSLGQKANMIEEIDTEIYDKSNYQETVYTILEKNWKNQWQSYWHANGVPVPIILVQLKPNSQWYLVKPDVTLSVVDDLNEYLQANGGDAAIIAFLDSEIDFRMYFFNLIVRLVSNLMAPAKTNIT